MKNIQFAIIGLCICPLLKPSTAFAALQTWDNGAANATWDTTSANWGGVAWTNGNDAFFGATGAGNINMGTAITAGTVTIGSPGYIFTGTNKLVAANLSVAEDVTFNSPLQVTANTTFTAANKTITASAGSGGTGASFGGVASGSTGAIGLTSTLILSGGTFVNGSGNTQINIGNASAGTGGLIIQSGATLNGSGSTAVGFGNNTGLVTINGGTLNSNVGLAVARNGGTGRLILNTGIINNTGTGNLRIGISNSANSRGTVDVNGGTINSASLVTYINDSATAATGAATLNIGGGTVNTLGLQFGGATGYAAGSSATLNVTSGTLNIGASGIAIGSTVTGTLATAVNLSGGTIGASANWSSSMNQNLGTTNGNITYRADNGAGSPVAHDIALSGVLSGTGGINKTGAGTLLLSGIDTYHGNTVVSAGTLSLADNAGLTFYIGSNGVNNSITGTGTLNLDGDFYFDLSGAGTGSWNIIDTGTLSELFSSTFTVNGWTNNGNDTWSTLFGGNTYTFSEATGLLTTVPEPSAWALLLGGIGLLAIFRFRHTRKIR